MSVMFQNSPYLETIYVGDGWNTDNVKYSDNMFYKCPLLVGGAGTTYSASNPTDKTYARVDNAPEAPGYLTHINDKSADPAT